MYYSRYTCIQRAQLCAYIYVHDCRINVSLMICAITREAHDLIGLEFSITRALSFLSKLSTLKNLLFLSFISVVNPPKQVLSSIISVAWRDEQIFQSFSIWNPLRTRTVSKRLATVTLLAINELYGQIRKPVYCWICWRKSQLRSYWAVTEIERAGERFKQKGCDRTIERGTIILRRLINE